MELQTFIEQLEITPPGAKRYRLIINNYPLFDGMSVSEFGRVAKVNTDLIHLMESEGLFKMEQYGRSKIFKAINPDRTRKVKRHVVNRIIETLKNQKAEQNRKERAERKAAERAERQAAQITPPLFQDMEADTIPEPVKKAPQNGFMDVLRANYAALKNNPEFTSFCVDHLKGITEQNGEEIRFKIICQTIQNIEL